MCQIGCMKRKKNSSRLPFAIFIFGIIVLAFAAVRSLLPKPQSADIFLVSDSAVVDGETTLTGVLRKDSPVGEPGGFFLALEDGKPVTLDIEGMDHLIGLSVSLTGHLTPSLGPHLPMVMQVSSLTVLE